MSEADYLVYQRAVASHTLPSARDGDGLVADVQLADEHGWTRHGHIDFLDNQVDRSSGTIRVRAVFANPDQFLTPGQFGRLRLPNSAPHMALLLPDGAVTTDQSRKIVMTVSADGHVVPKVVETGPILGGLRLIRTGLDPADRVVIDGLMRARPGGLVTPVPGEIKTPQS
jgi:RND family efflux transporter MFP subunit